MKVEITSLGQNVSFTSGEQINVIQMRLPNGKIVKAIVDDENAQAILTSFIHGGSPVVDVSEPPLQTVAAAMFEEGHSDDGQPAFVFKSPTPPPARPKVRVVGADSMGNPIVEMDGPRPQDVIGQPSPGADEDGVSQL